MKSRRRAVRKYGNGTDLRQGIQKGSSAPCLIDAMSTTQAETSMTQAEPRCGRATVQASSTATHTRTGRHENAASHGAGKQHRYTHLAHRGEPRCGQAAPLHTSCSIVQRLHHSLTPLYRPVQATFDALMHNMHCSVVGYPSRFWSLQAAMMMGFWRKCHSGA